VDTSELNADASSNTARREKGATKKRNDHATTQTTTNNKRYRFKPQTKKKNKTCENCDPTNLELSYIFNNTPQRKRRRGHREGERVHLLFDIYVTAPVLHFDTSELNAPASLNTARREKGATKKRKTKPTTQTTTEGTVSNHKQKETVTRVRLVTDGPRVVAYIQQHTITEGAVATERKREYTYCVA
jgi:hypothetical protein